MDKKWYWIGGGIALYIVLILIKAYTLAGTLTFVGIIFGFYYLQHKGTKALNKFMSRKVLPAMLKNKPQEERERQLIRNYFTPEIAQEGQRKSNQRFGNVVGGVGGVIGGTSGRLIGATSKGITSLSNSMNKLLPSAYDRGITDEEFDEIFKNRVAELNLREKALDVLGLDETQITELLPVCLEGYYIDENDGEFISAVGRDGVNRTCAYEVTWLFFTSKQLCIYQYRFNMWKDSKQELTQEYYWKDITNFTSSSENVTIRNNFTGAIKGSTEVYYFTIIVPGDKYKCVYKDTPEANRAIRGMKAYLRDIKERNS